MTAFLSIFCPEPKKFCQNPPRGKLYAEKLMRSGRGSFEERGALFLLVRLPYLDKLSSCPARLHDSTPLEAMINFAPPLVRTMKNFFKRRQNFNKRITELCHQQKRAALFSENQLRGRDPNRRGLPDNSVESHKQTIHEQAKKG